MAFSCTTPHFFKIIFYETIRKNMLSIPNKFVRLYGQTLSKLVRIKLPCGAEWKMELSPHEGKVWLEKGWPEFAKHYSIVRGHLLTFRYEGNSRFRVVIYDMSTVEIDYPPVCLDEEKRGSSKRKNIADEPIEKIFDNSKTRKIRKRMRTSRADSKRVLETSDRKRNSKEKEDLPVKIEGSGSKSARCTTKRLTRNERISALEKASDFDCNRPFFKVVMQPYCLRSSVMNFKSAFARRYLKSMSGDGILKLPNNRKTWPVKYSYEEYGGKSITRFHSGWKEFVRGNNLEMLDVCVFVLLSSKKVKFEVVIFRENLVGNSPEPSESEESSGNETEHVDNDTTIETNVPNSRDDSPQRQETTLRKTSLGPKAKRRKTTLSALEKARILEGVRFVSDKPSFKVVMQPSYVHPGYHLPVPLYFGKRYIKKERDIILRVPNIGTWSVQFMIWHIKSGRLLPEFYSGWETFVGDNDLEIGDTCVFELIDATEFLFDVHIFRIHESNSVANRRQCQGQANKSVLRTKPLTFAEKARLLERARFASERPFFKVVIQPSYSGSRAYIPVPSDFVKEYIESRVGDVALRVPNSTKTWHAKLIRRRLISGRVTVDISHGWKEFAKCNDLKLADVGIFELVDESEISFRVSIVRAPRDYRQNDM